MSVSNRRRFRVCGAVLFLLLAGGTGARGADFAVSTLDTRVIGPATWRPGAHAALRVIVTDRRTGAPVRGTVRLGLVSMKDGKPSGRVQTLLDQETNKLGTLDARFQTPKLASGPYRLTVAVETAAGDDTVDQDVQLQESQQILLTTDKPVYQPGQTMHLRALALDTATRQPVSGSPITFEVEDGRGDKVFKAHGTLSAFGVAGTDFTLADEVNMGDFHVRAILPDGQAEKTVRVDRYVLPKFRVKIETSEPYYLPGQIVQGTVDAHYFFGKPASGASVDIDVDTQDIGTTKIGQLHGVTDGQGVYKFEYQLPNSFVGQPFEQGKAVVEFAAAVRDTANHTERNSLQLPVVPQPVLLSLVPESPALIPGIENRIYVAAARPDGTPLKNTTLILSATPSGQGMAAETRTLKTDALGIAAFAFKPLRQAYTVTADYANVEGQDISATATLQPIAGQAGILLRTDETFAKVGDNVRLLALSSEPDATVYFDVVRDGQTLLTKAEAPRSGAAGTTLPITSDMTGTLTVHAYTILPNEDIVRDTRTIVVSPADDLNVAVSADRGQYRPGDDAVLRIAVTDRDRNPVAAAVGLAVVDESVFALSELQPGLEKIYFTLEKELMEPRYEIHGLTPVGIFENKIPRIPDDVRQRAGSMLLSGRPQSSLGTTTDSYDIRWNKLKPAVMAEMEKHRLRLADAIAKYDESHTPHLRGSDTLWPLYDNHSVDLSDILDPWKHPYKTSVTGDEEYTAFFTLTSAGPDGKWDTGDDVSVGPWSNEGFAFGGRHGFPGGGGFGGAGVFHGEERVPVLAAPPLILKDAAVTNNAVSFAEPAAASGSAEPRVRSYFPETLYWNPAVITDDSGQAQVGLPLADSITTWRVSAMASSASGLLGSATAGIKVFQDFFADLDLPVALTQGDRVDVPVSLYNYLPEAQDVTVSLSPDPWFELDGPGTQRIHLESNQVSVVYFPIAAREIGDHAFLVTARGTKLSDAVKRPVTVLPNGKEVRAAVSDRLEGSADRSITIPDAALPGASSLWIKLYPGTFSQVVEGLDGMLRMPGGCFEQTSSTTYPDVLVLGYLKQTKKINPEIQLKAEQYINVGYQRLVTFECRNGGFSWFGNEPAHQVLTAYGLLEFSDMAKVHDVDPAVIARTQTWLAGKQHDDGSWTETGQGIAEGIINRQTNALRTTAYIAWALAESGYTGSAVGRGLDYVRAHASEATDPYTLAVILNLYTAPGVKTGASDIADRLMAAAKTTGKTAYWAGDTTTFTGAQGDGADIETTGLAAYGLLKYGRAGAFTDKILTYLVQSKDSYGTWSTTQGTVWSLKSLLYATNASASTGSGTVAVTVNGEPAATVTLTDDNADVVRQIDATKYLRAGQNGVHLEFHGTGSLLYQVVSRYYTPWTRETTPEPDRVPPLSLTVDYDKTTLALDDTATATVTIRNNTNLRVEMPLIDVGVPPGFDVVPDNLEAAVQSGRISKYTVAARQIILYLEKLDPGATATVTYGLHARFPVKALTPESRAYPYYDPVKVTVARPQGIEVRRTL